MEKKIYIVTIGEYSDYGIDAVFSTRKKPFDYENANIQPKDFAPKAKPKFNIGDEIKTTNEEPLTITKIDDKGYWSGDLFICSFDDADKWKLVKQKPADKVDPKFHVGDWVVFIATESVYQVEKIENSEYTLRHILGGSLCLSFSNEELIREWTIQDAKAGDVLAGIYGTFIFKGEGYCGILSDNTFIISTGNNGWTKCLHPATKEQRDTLMNAMADAGYTFDFEKKELKKIGQKPAEWSEEDKCILLSIKCVIDNVWHSTSDIDTGYSIEELKEMWEWLDEIWQRVKYHTEWSEEDERICQCLIEDQEESLDKVSNDKHGHSEIISDLTEMYDERIDWLKSLRHLKQWKPSDEQIEAIRLARSFVTDDFGEHQTLSEILMELEEQLKALKKLK